MRDAPPTFSESWFRVANQRIALRPSVRIRRQNYRGQRWMVLENALDNNFFRVHPASYEFIARLRPERTVEEVWRECLDRFPNEAPEAFAPDYFDGAFGTQPRDKFVGRGVNA